MATNSDITRNYHFTDGDLALLANTVAIAMRRDITEFTSYGVLAAQVDAMIALCDDFQELPNDEILRTDLSYAVEQKDAARNTVLSTMRSISVRAKAVFGDNSAKFRSLNPGNISKLPDSELLIAARQVHSAAVTNLIALTPEGITAGYLTTFDDNIQLFEDAVDEVENKKILRDDATEHKVIMGNQLYALITKYCDYGKIIFENSSPAKYNDYVIYGSTGSITLTAPIGLTYNISENLFAWSAVTNATSYQLEGSSDGITYEEYYAGGETRFNIQPEGNTEYYYRCRARNSGGYGPYSDVYRFTYWTALPAPLSGTAVWSTENPTQVTISCETVTGSDFYSICKSVVPPEAEAGAWVYLPNSTNPEWVISAERNKRMYFRINGATSYLVGTQSSPFFVEVG